MQGLEVGEQGGQGLLQTLEARLAPPGCQPDRSPACTGGVAGSVVTGTAELGAGLGGSQSPVCRDEAWSAL